MLVEPGQRLVDDLVTPPADVGQRHRRVLRKVEVVEVAIEALVESPFRVEDVGSDECAGRPAAPLEQRGEGEARGVEDEAAVVAHAVRRRNGTREDRRVGRQRQRHRGHRLVEAYAPGCQRVEIGRHPLGLAVAAELVGPRRVERENEDVQILGPHAPRQRAEPDAARGDDRGTIEVTRRRRGRGRRAGPPCRRTRGGGLPAVRATRSGARCLVCSSPGGWTVVASAPGR